MGTSLAMAPRSASGGSTHPEQKSSGGVRRLLVVWSGSSAVGQPGIPVEGGGWRREVGRSLGLGGLPVWCEPLGGELGPGPAVIRRA